MPPSSARAIDRASTVRFLIATILFALTISAAFAEPMAPDELVRSVTNDVITSVTSDPNIRNGHTAAMIVLLDTKVAQYFDFDRMTALAVGRAWRRATPAQQQALTTEFRNLLVRTYAAALTAYRDQKISFVPLTMTGEETDVTVQSYVEQSTSNRRISIDYDMGKSGTTWKVYDVTIDGISLLLNYRNQFASETRRNGIDGLITALRTKNERVD